MTKPVMTRMARAIVFLSGTRRFQNKLALHHTTVAVPIHAERFASSVLPCPWPLWIKQVTGRVYWRS